MVGWHHRLDGRTWRPGMLRFMGSQSSARLSDWTELNWSTPLHSFNEQGRDEEPHSVKLVDRNCMWSKYHVRKPLFLNTMHIFPRYGFLQIIDPLQSQFPISARRQQVQWPFFELCYLPVSILLALPSSYWSSRLSGQSSYQGWWVPVSYLLFYELG